MGIIVRLPFVPPKRRPSRLRRTGRDITAALVSTNHLFFYLLFQLFFKEKIGKIGKFGKNRKQLENFE